jgi:hypothetical protein
VVRIHFVDVSNLALVQPLQAQLRFQHGRGRGVGGHAQARVDVIALQVNRQGAVTIGAARLWQRVL